MTRQFREDEFQLERGEWIIRQSGNKPTLGRHARKAAGGVFRSYNS